MTAIARAAPRRGDGMTTVHNSNSRQPKNAPPKRGNLEISESEHVTRPRLAAQ
jgi:hypothetical protein